jgi:hypothetical protein
MARMKFVGSVLLISALNIFNCKDLGNELAAGGLTATTFLVVLNPGGTATVIISGGNPPYTISRQPSATYATATLTNNANSTATLLIQAVSAAVSGTTFVKIKDTDTHDAHGDASLHDENEIEIEIRVTPAAAGVSFSTQIQPILTSSCAVSGCHVSGGSAPFLLTPGVSRAQLVGQNATVGPCQGQPRVQQGVPANSVLIKRLEGSSCGNRMPLGGSSLPAASIQLMKDWIEQGAQDN